jgi:predicted permease
VDASVAAAAPVRVLQATTTGTPVDGGLGAGLAAAFVLLLGLVGGAAALVAALTLVVGRVATDRLADWETGLLAVVVAGGGYALGRLFTLSEAGRYSLGTAAALGAGGLLCLWGLARAARWLRSAVGDAGGSSGPDSG